MLVLESLLGSESFTFLRPMSCPWQRCKIVPLSSRAEVYVWRHRSVAWSYPKMRQVPKGWAWIKVSYAKFQLSIYNALWVVPKNRQGGINPRPGRVKQGWKFSAHGATLTIFPQIVIQRLDDSLINLAKETSMGIEELGLKIGFKHLTFSWRHQHPTDNRYMGIIRKVSTTQTYCVGQIMINFNLG